MSLKIWNTFNVLKGGLYTQVCLAFRKGGFLFFLRNQLRVISEMEGIKENKVEADARTEVGIELT